MRRPLSLIGIAALLALLSGCPFKKKQPPVPQQGQAPTVQPEPTPPPAELPAEPQPAPPPAQPQPEKAETPSEAPKPKKPSPAKKPAAPASTNQGQQAAGAQPAPTQTSKLIIQEGNAPNSQGQAGTALEDSSSHNKQTTEQLLKDTETNLNKINRPLSPDEQAMVAQIREYMKQSRDATNSSDAVRAHNLALKARLLSDELVKH